MSSWGAGDPDVKPNGNRRTDLGISKTSSKKGARDTQGASRPNGKAKLDRLERPCGPRAKNGLRSEAAISPCSLGPVGADVTGQPEPAKHPLRRGEATTAGKERETNKGRTAYPSQDEGGETSSLDSKQKEIMP